MTLDDLNNFSKNSFVENLGIRFTAFEEGSITGQIDITGFHLQPWGYVHGGVYMALAETMAGAGSAILVEKQGKVALGTNINSQHIATAGPGRITATGELIHRGIYKHIWDIKITDDTGKLISISRVTNSIKEKENPHEPGMISDE
ncbi:MAG: PaaI family thioesterase [Bacteroidales bacterium]